VAPFTMSASVGSSSRFAKLVLDSSEFSEFVARRPSSCALPSECCDRALRGWTDDEVLPAVDHDDRSGALSLEDARRKSDGAVAGAVTGGRGHGAKIGTIALAVKARGVADSRSLPLVVVHGRDVGRVG